MRFSLLERLRCPFCGGRLDPGQAPGTVRDERVLITGVLGCECSAYPVIEGIAYLQANREAKLALQCLERRDPIQALDALMQQEPEQATRAAIEPATFRAGLDRWCPGPEKDYLFHRFSDPTFRVMESVLRVLAPGRPMPEAWILDVCGGSGHLARLLGGLHPEAPVVVADRDFARLRLAQRFLAPEGEMVCCDAAQPLPFRHGSFGWVLCSDGLNYVWPRRLLVSEMLRLAEPRGVVMAFHMHNGLCENFSPGLPLSPSTFRSLFETWPVRLYSESAWLASVVRGGDLDLDRDWTDEDLRTEPALCAIATRDRNLFCTYPLVGPGSVSGTLAINPLYQTRSESASLRLERRFPSAYYEEEFHTIKDYLPEEVILSAEEASSLRAGALVGRLPELLQRRVLLDLPVGYL